MGRRNSHHYRRMNAEHRRAGRILLLLSAGTLMAGVLVLYLDVLPERHHYHTRSALLLIDGISQSPRLSDWRSWVEQSCRSATSGVDVQALGERRKSVFGSSTMTRKSETHPEDSLPSIQRCNQVFIEFGSRVEGSSIADFVEAGLGSCVRKDLDTEMKPVHFNLETKTVEDAPAPSQFAVNINRIMMARGTGPEEYCFYGFVDGRSMLPRLRDLEEDIMSLQPKPLKHVHFVTGLTPAMREKSVAMGEVAVQRQLRVGHTASNEVGYSVESLLRETLAGFDSTSAAPTPEKSQDNHVILRLNSDSPLFLEPTLIDTLCELVRNHHSIDLFVADTSSSTETEATKDKLAKCGVPVQSLAP